MRLLRNSPTTDRLNLRVYASASAMMVTARRMAARVDARVSAKVALRMATIRAEARMAVAAQAREKEGSGAASGKPKMSASRIPCGLLLNEMRAGREG
mmetsp:Transcript_12021/g.22452  ORF Transcript_12021/g.22452 Transcript_12021/m.22452 type:complete len:98 (+) Transcript_12021:1411-1704(+)